MLSRIGLAPCSSRGASGDPAIPKCSSTWARSSGCMRCIQSVKARLAYAGGGVSKVSTGPSDNGCPGSMSKLQTPMDAAPMVSESSRSPRCATSSARRRSWMTVASIRSGTAVRNRNSWTDRAFCDGASVVNGPCPRTTPQIAATVTVSRLRLRPDTPNRTAAQSSSGTGAYSSAGPTFGQSAGAPKVAPQTISIASASTTAST